MKDKFDKILSNKIKDTLENREIIYNPEHWEMLVAKKEKKKRKVFFLWRFAGIALLFIIVGSLSKFLFPDPDVIQSEEIEIIIGEKKPSKKDIINKTHDNTNITDEIKINKIDTSSSSNKPFHKINQIKLNTITSSNKKNTDRETKKASEITYHIISQKDSLKIKALDNIIFNESIKDKNIVQNDIETDTVENIKSIINNQKNIEKLIITNKDNELNKILNTRYFKVGINVSSMINSIKENKNSNIGFSGGVTVEIPVLKKFDISTGIIYTSQKFNLQNQDISLVTDIVSNGGVQLTSKEATMKGVEIPINVKYNFTISEKKLFVSAGFSSTSHFKENVTTDYLVNTKTAFNTLNSNGDEIIQYSIVQSNKTIETNQTPSNTFNFANMLNLSFGMEFPMNNKQQSIVIEPYFKYSLTPVTHQEVNYTTVGLYLRYNFSFKRK